MNTVHQPRIGGAGKFWSDLFEAIADQQFAYERHNEMSEFPVKRTFRIVNKFYYGTVLRNCPDFTLTCFEGKNHDLA